MKKIIKYLTLCFLIVGLFPTLRSFAYDLSPNGGQVNSNLTYKSKNLVGNVGFQSWHSSWGKKWVFSSFGSGNIPVNKEVLDGETQGYFSGTSKIYPAKIGQVFELPEDAKAFISTYGESKLGVRVNVGGTGAVYDTVTVDISSSELTVKFFPIMNYNNNNFIGNNNTLVWNSMTYKTYVPQVMKDYGYNYMSKNREGTVETFGEESGLRITESMMRNGYKADGDFLRFYGDEWTTNSSNVAFNSGLQRVLPTFWGGGSLGLTFEYPILVELFTMDISTETPSIWDNEYNAPDGTKWIKSGDPFYIGTNSYSSSNDSLVKNNGSFINVIGSDGTNGYLQGKIDSYNTNGVINNSSGLSILGNSYLRRINSDGSENINSTRLYNQYQVTASGDTDYQCGAFSRLVEYPSGQNNTGDEKIYKNSPVSGFINFKSDSTAPTSSGVPSSDWTKGNVTINASATDSRSGMDYINILKEETEVATGLNSASFTEDNEGVHNYKITASDNVGNIDTQPFTINIDRTAPTTAEKNIIKNFNETTLDFKLSVANIVETGSGVSEIWVKYYPKGNQKNEVRETLVNNNGSYEGGRNLYDIFNGSADIVTYEIWGIDKVGNSQLIYTNDIDLFTLSANIERILTPNNPVFSGGEKGILKIKMYGGVDKLKITFPTELTDKDSTLNAEFNVTPQKISNKDYEFFVPIYADNKKYNVQVKGYKNGREKEVYPSFDVKGSILDQLRTRIRIR